MRKTLLTLLASAALAFGIAGQASAGGRDHHGHRHYERHYHSGHHDHHRHWKHRGHHRHYHHRPYYSGYRYGPPPPPVYYQPYPGAYGGYYALPGFSVYIGR